MSFGGGDNFYTKSPLSPPLSLPFSFHSSPQETPSSFRLSSIIGEEFLTPWTLGRKLLHKGDKMARLYRFFFFSFPTSKTLSSSYVRGSDDEEKKKKKKEEKKSDPFADHARRRNLVLWGLDPPIFMEESFSSLYLAPMIIFPFKIFLRDTRNRMETGENITATCFRIESGS